LPAIRTGFGNSVGGAPPEWEITPATVAPGAADGGGAVGEEASCADANDAAAKNKMAAALHFLRAFGGVFDRIGARLHGGVVVALFCALGRYGITRVT